MRDDTYSSPAIEERWLQSRRVAEQLRAQAEFSRVLITSSRTLVERGAALSQHAGVAANTEEDEREARARQRLLEWEAEDLSAVVPSNDGIESALPDWSGRIWFVSRQGIVGTVASLGR